MFTIFTAVVHCSENQKNHPILNTVSKLAIFTATLWTKRLI